MDAVRQNLQTLQGLLDEGLITQGEYKQRRKAVLDAATGTGSRPNTAAPGKSSVFSRLGGGSDDATGRTAGAVDDDKWGHDGFAAVYGGGASRKVTVVKKGSGHQNGAVRYKPLAGAISKRAAGKGDLRSKLTGGKTTDLRAKLSGGGGSKQQLSKPQARGPAKCPW